jgi:O-antigen biosynthesis protein
MTDLANLGSAASALLHRLQSRGLREVGQRVARRAAQGIVTKFHTGELDFPLLPQDICDSTRLRLEPPPAVDNGAPLKLAWLCTPPGPGSGGHTTLFRMVSALEERGHDCTLLLYNRHGIDLRRQAAVIRESWPDVRADVTSVPEAIAGYDGCIASSWDTAHVLASRGRASTNRFYFIQDFEPFFYPRGSIYSLAEDTYRFGFHNIALGRMVSQVLKEQTGIASTEVSFGCDTNVYCDARTDERKGVVFYARQSVERRGYLLAKTALEEFHLRHPEQPIHVYGDPMDGWSIPHVHHSRLNPTSLNRLYNSCLAGLAMSFTNISLVAEEMLAAGMTPVVNDHSYARMDLPNPDVVWAPPTPGGLVDALCRVVEERPGVHASGVRPGWAATQAAVAEIIQAEVSACKI